MDTRRRRRDTRERVLRRASRDDAWRDGRLSGAGTAVAEPTLAGELTPGASGRVQSVSFRLACTFRATGSARRRRGSLAPDSLDRGQGGRLHGARRGALRPQRQHARLRPRFPNLQPPRAFAVRWRSETPCGTCSGRSLRILPDAEITTRPAGPESPVRQLHAAGIGPLSSRDNVRAFSGDPDQPLACCPSSTTTPEPKTATKAAIFEQAHASAP